MKPVLFTVGSIEIPLGKQEQSELLAAFDQQKCGRAWFLCSVPQATFWKEHYDGWAKGGIIMGYEESRLSRSCADWHRPRELCVLFDTLIGDADGIHNPGLGQRRLSAYITWEEYERLEATIEENRQKMEERLTRRQAIRSGAALLTGLVRCGLCGRAMRVIY
jgi:hypothetical protein